MSVRTLCTATAFSKQLLILALFVGVDAGEVLDALLLLALLCLLSALEVVLQLAPQLSRLGLGSLGMFYLNVKWCNENREKV